MFILFARSAHENALEDHRSIVYVCVGFDLDSRLGKSEDHTQVYTVLAADEIYKGA
jgi:hypothetical protein